MISHSAAGYDPSGKPRRVAEGVYSLSQRSGGRVHAFLIDDGKTLTLIDAMWDTDGAPVLRAIARSDGRSRISRTSSSRMPTGRISAASRR